MITIDHLTKEYKNIRAVDDLSLQISPGELFGLLGPNGAGKTTTIRLLATVLQPTSGTAVVNGHDIRHDAEAVRRSVGVLTAEIGLYDRLTARENLRYAGALFGLSGVTREKRITELSTMLDMDRFIDRRAGTFSTGMKQKVAIARAVIHNPAVVIFDEPTAGLDMLAAQTVMAMMTNFKNSGKTVILSTHDMPIAQRLCDRVGIMHRGRLVNLGTTAEVLTRFAAPTLEEAFLLAIGEAAAKMALVEAERAAMLAAERKQRR